LRQLVIVTLLSAWYAEACHSRPFVIYNLVWICWHEFSAINSQKASLK